jgi:hypothetical protein
MALEIFSFANRHQANLSAKFLSGFKISALPLANFTYKF